MIDYEVAKEIFHDLKIFFRNKSNNLNGALPNINETSKSEEEGSNRGIELIEAYSQKKEEVKRSKEPIFAEKNDEANKNAGLDIDFTEEKLLQGIVYSEILGKPKAKTRRR